MSHQYDVLVVGAGMIGMSAALGVAQQGLRVGLIESHPVKDYQFPLAAGAYDHRVVAIVRATQRLFEKLDIWQSIKNARLSSYEAMYVWDSEREGKIHFLASENFEPNLGYIIEQSVILSALWQKIKTHPNITCFFNEKISSVMCNEAEAKIKLQEGAELISRLVIGADGQYSFIRESLKIETVWHDYQQTALVATLQSEKLHRAIAYQRFAKSGTLAWLPLADPHLTSIVWSTTHEEAKRLSEMTVEDFNRAITRENEGFLGDLTLASNRLTFRLSTHHAQKYATPRCVLVGDAAHTIHPLAGLGVNLGFLDLAVLFEIVQETIHLKRDLGSLSRLKKYERRRRWHNGMIRQVMTLFKEGFGSPSPFVEQLRNKGLNFVDQQRTLKRFFVSQAFL